MKKTNDLNPNRNSPKRVMAFQELQFSDILGTSRVDEPQQAVVENQLSETALAEENSSILDRNRALLQYIATISNSNNAKDEFNYEFIRSLVEGGANINIADVNGQTIFHEVARSWNTDIAEFLIDLGCDINKQDSYGRSALHVSAAVDFVEMTEFLLDNNADIDVRTYGELQAPIHYAAKNGATRALKMLLSFQANIDTTDAKQRTPLQVAAEWCQSKTAKILITEGAACCLLDVTGNSALCELIDHLPNLAVEALDQLHSTNVLTMEEFYHLQHLESSKEKVETKSTRTALETAVATRNYEVVTHPVMQRLIQIKWDQYGRFSNIYQLIFHTIFGIVWTAVALGTPENSDNLYKDITAKIWRITLGVMIILMTVYDIGMQIYKTYKARKLQKRWIDWKITKLQYDLDHCHPRWPQEERFVKNEMTRVRNLTLFNANDAWFYLDWMILFLIVINIVTHFLFLRINTSASRYVYTRVLSIMNLFVWLRLLKFTRPIRGIGTLVLILSETMSDFVNWAFLYFIIMVPFTASFWINFGASSPHPVRGYDQTAELIYSVFQIAIGDNFNRKGLETADKSIAHILLVMYVTSMTIVTLNLLIALLSETFSRVYSNAVANSIMQRAMDIIESERYLTRKQKQKHRYYMKQNCSPEVRRIQQITSIEKNEDVREQQNEIGEAVMEAHQVLNDRFGKIYGKDKTSDFDTLMVDLRNTCRVADKMFKDLQAIKMLLNRRSSPGKILQHRHAENDAQSFPATSSKRKAKSPKKVESRSVTTSLQEYLPEWMTRKTEEKPKGNRRKNDRKSGSQSDEVDDGKTKRRRVRKREQKKRPIEQEEASKSRRRGKRDERKENLEDRGNVKPAYEFHLSKNERDLQLPYVKDWDAVSIDSSDSESAL